MGKVWSALLAGLSFIAVYGTGTISVGETTFYVAAILAGVVFAITNFLFVGVLASILHRTKITSDFRQNFTQLMHVDSFIIMGSVLVAVIYVKFGILAMAAFALVATIAAKMIRQIIDYVKVALPEARARVQHRATTEVSQWLLNREHAINEDATYRGVGAGAILDH